jgi:hypothetical protein
MPCGRALLPRDSDGWTPAGAVNIETDYAVAVAAGMEWQRQPGTGPQWMETMADYRAVVDRDVPGLFTAAEQIALRAWIVEGLLSPELASLIEPIRVLQGLHVLRGRGHVAWMERIRSYGAGKNRAQPLVRSIGGEDRFIVTKPPAGAVRIAPGSWSVGGAGAFLGTANAGVGPDPVEIIIDLDGGRIVGETAEPPAPPVEPPPPPPGDPALRLVRERLAEHRSTWDRQRKGKAKAAETERTLRGVEAAVDQL